MKKSDIVKLIQEIELTQPINIQFSGTKNNTPRPIGYTRSDKRFMPDIVAKFNHKKDFYAIENDISDRDTHLLVSKWILFAIEAKKFFGTFFLIIQKSKVKSFQNIITDKKLDIQLIQI